MLPIVVQNMIKYATEHGLKYLTLTAASGDLVPLFEKHGFIVEDNQVAKKAIALDMGISMEMKISDRLS